MNLDGTRFLQRDMSVHTGLYECPQTIMQSRAGASRPGTFLHANCMVGILILEKRTAFVT